MRVLEWLPFLCMHWCRLECSPKLGFPNHQLLGFRPPFLWRGAYSRFCFRAAAVVVSSAFVAVWILLRSGALAAGHFWLWKLCSSVWVLAFMAKLYTILHWSSATWVVPFKGCMQCCCVPRWPFDSQRFGWKARVFWDWGSELWSSRVVVHDYTSVVLEWVLLLVCFLLSFCFERCVMCTRS